MNTRKPRIRASPATSRETGRRSARRRPAGKRALNKERTRKEILHAALELFSKKGFDRTTAKQISDKAGVAEGTLYNYFKTKEEVALYFFEQELAALFDWYRKNEPLHRKPLSEKFFAIVYQHLEQMSPYEDFIGTVYLRAFQPASNLSPLRVETRERNLRYLRFIKEVIEDSEEEGLIRRLGEVAA